MSKEGQPTRWRRSLLVAVAAVATGLLAFVPAASAARDPIAGGETDLHLKKGMERKLNNLGAAIQGVGAGNVSGRKIDLEARDGMLDPTDAQGFVEVRGGFKLVRGNRGTAVWNITVNTAKGAVYAKVAGARMQLGTLLIGTSSRDGFGVRFKYAKLALTPKAAKRISNRLGLRGARRINGGRVLSNTFAAVQPQTVTVVKGSATLTASGTALAKLAAKGVKIPSGISPLAPATQPTPTSLLVPVSGGSLAPDGSAGTVQTTGGVQIVKDAEPFDPTVRLANASFDFGANAVEVTLELLPKPPFPGAAGTPTLASIVLPKDAVTANPVTRQIAIDGEARLRSDAATTLNNVFNQPAPEPPPSSNFVVGDPLGTFTVGVQAQ